MTTITSLFGFSKREEILQLEEAVGEDNPLEPTLVWEQLGKRRSLTIIATPYHRGRHYAQTPKAFVPIIQQLTHLHKAGFAHGDIRAYNIIFGERAEEGWLIDFDYGGLLDAATYPVGYKGILADGTRLGKEGQKLKAIDDWYALATLIDFYHGIDLDNFNEPSFRKFWRKVPSVPTPEQVQGLVTFLGETESEVELLLTLKMISRHAILTVLLHHHRRHWYRRGYRIH